MALILYYTIYKHGRFKANYTHTHLSAINRNPIHPISSSTVGHRQCLIDMAMQLSRHPLCQLKILKDKYQKRAVNTIVDGSIEPSSPAHSHREKVTSIDI